MRSNVTSSLAAWVALALTAAVFPACAKSIVGDSSGTDGGGVSAGNDASTVASGDDAGEGDPSQGGGSNPSDDAGNSSPSTGFDSGSPSGGNDSGSTNPPPSDDAGVPPPVADSAPPPPSATTCPDTSTYQEEYALLASFGLGTSCTTDSDCGSSDCCYDGTLAQGAGLCVTQ